MRTDGLDPGEGGHDPLTPGEYAAIAAAGRDLRRVRRGERVAAGTGVMTLGAAVISAPFVLGSGVGIALVVILGVVGWREWSLRRGLRRLDPQAAAGLAWNQVALGLTLAGYGAVRLWEGPSGALNAPELEQMPELAAAAEGIVRLAHAAVYAGLIVGACVMQGSQAIYYRSLGKTIRRAGERHPAWAMRVHRAAWSGEAGVGAGVSVQDASRAGRAAA
jgi:hypothetical protein